MAERSTTINVRRCKQMTSNKLKQQAKKVLDWGLAIQECRKSGLAVFEWCRQHGVAATT